jgi:hypothetical protein
VKRRPGTDSPSSLENTLPRERAVRLADGSTVTVPKLRTLDYLVVIDAIESLPGEVIEAAVPHFVPALSAGQADPDLGGFGLAAALINALPGMFRAGLPEVLNLIAVACKLPAEQVAELYPEDHAALIEAWLELNRVEEFAARLKKAWARLGQTPWMASLAARAKCFESTVDSPQP